MYIDWGPAKVAAFIEEHWDAYGLFLFKLAPTTPSLLSLAILEVPTCDDCEQDIAEELEDTMLGLMVEFINITRTPEE